MRVRMCVPALWENHNSAQKHRVSPKFGEQLALNAHVLHPLRVMRGLDLRHFLRELNSNGVWRRGIEVHALGFAVEISWFRIPVLAFAFVHG